MEHQAGPLYYEIRIRGHLGETLLGAFPDLRSETDGGETVLVGALADQAALYGVLAQIEALGLALLEVRRVRRDRSHRAMPAHPARREQHGDAVARATGAVTAPPPPPRRPTQPDREMA